MEQNKMRCHISIVLENAGRLLGVLFAIVLAQLDNIIDNISDLFQMEVRAYFVGFGIVLFLFFIVLLFHLNRWYKTTICLERGLLIVERNTLNKSKNTYTISNISNIDMEQSLFERLIGTYKIKIDTNSSALADKTDIKIVFSKLKAIEFKREIMSLMGQVEVTDLLEIEDNDFDVAYSLKSIVMNCFYTANIFSVLFLIGGVVGAFFLVRYGETNYTIHDLVKDALGGLAAILIAIISAIYTLSIGFFKFYGFKVRRKGERIQLDYGLLRKNMLTIPVDKINGIRVIQPFFSRIFGRYQVEAINIGTGDEKNESSSLLLSCTKEEVKMYMAVLLPEFEDFVEKPIEKQSTKYRLHIAFNILVELIVSVIILLIINYFVAIPSWIEWVALGSFFIIIVVGYIFSYYTVGYYVGEKYLIISRGIFNKTCLSIRYEKIQHIQMNETCMSKITGLKRATIFILADLLNSSMALPFVEEKIFEKVAKKMIKA
ncbi:putative membrane protein YdbT with pleckstrin-like domain [Lachnotalea glycerini]|nr:PH domain-containing protein [Lachnotalea glycerini]PXV93587.1 putative membrane protein YdbT with pleckstrin-like domain [Lachnotalea glycerini]